jgi:Pyruvate/2-oxoacid:ferredoxin oxidoreductase delta subunit/flavodoxin
MVNTKRVSMENYNTIKKTVVFYFSGTGNAKQIALWISEFANRRSIDCQTINIEKTDIREIEPISTDMLMFFISPIHGFNYPKIMLDFISRFPKGRNKIVLMNTRAGMKIGRFVTPGLTGIAFILSTLILKRKGYKIVGQIPFDMPSNWISIHPALNENTVKYIHKRILSLVEKHTQKIFSGKSDFLSYRDLIQDILISPVSLAYYIAGRFAFAKSFYASSDCDNCGLCLKHCPVDAIKIKNNRPYWTYNCESCMRCMNICPKKAIETAHGLFVVVSILSSAIITILVDTIFTIEVNSGFFRPVLSTIVFFVVLWPLYKVQHLLLRQKLIGKLISFTSLTHYKFWGRYKPTTDVK